MMFQSFGLVQNLNNEWVWGFILNWILKLFSFEKNPKIMVHVQLGNWQCEIIYIFLQELRNKFISIHDCLYTAFIYMLHVNTCMLFQ